ncbi:MAG: hypothetical protein AMJ88_04165 [Anaerolineae bacterium SM23_ 63]|nr:MAG: hypothetical protein AMJ88_04165 [Anaerolineae bacterium SM23_ 63]HEY45216.1 hypothetical protein [Anaerolineae bacterium]
MLGPMVPERFYVMGMYRMREAEILEDVKVSRLLKSIHPVHQTFLERILYGVGATLVSIGEKLRDRYTPTISSPCEAYQTKI